MNPQSAQLFWRVAHHLTASTARRCAALPFCYTFIQLFATIGIVDADLLKETAQYAKIGTVESVRFLAKRVGHIAEKMYQTQGQEHV